METKTNRVLEQLFKDCYNNASSADFIHEVNSHPDFPTLKSISDTLEKFGIENIPVRLKADELEQLDSPFLAYIKSKGQNELAYAKPKEGGNIHYLSESNKATSENLNDFAQHFTGIAVLLDFKKAVLPPTNTKRRREQMLFKSTIALALACALGFFLLTVYKSPILLFSNLTTSVFLFTKVLGLSLSSALVIKDLGQSNNLLDRVCKIGGNSDCDTVLESKLSTIYGWLKWSDLGFIYFLFGLLSLADGAISTITLFSILAVPYVGISLYQQFYIIKKICPFCLAVVAILIIEFSVSLVVVVDTDYNLSQFINAAMLVLGTATFYLLIKALVISKQVKKEMELSYNRLKRIPQVITEVVKRENKLVIPSMPMHCLSFGSKDNSALKIQVFLSMHCGHCAKLFSQLNNTLNKGGEIQVLVFMNFDPKNNHQISYLENLLTIYKNGKLDRVWTDIGDWYANLSNGKFKQQAKEPSEEIKKLFLTTNNLMRVNQIQSLPKLYIEGFEKSTHYQLSDYLESKSVLKNMHRENQQKEMIINT